MMLFFCCETLPNNSTNGSIVCNQESACNYGLDEICDFGNICSDGTIICDGTSCANSQSENNINIIFSSNYPIGGFQFNITGVEIIGVTGGIALEYGLNISSSSNLVLGFSISGIEIPESSGVLVSLDIAGDANNACIDNVIISDSFGIALTANHDCSSISIL